MSEAQQMAIVHGTYYHADVDLEPVYFDGNGAIRRVVTITGNAKRKWRLIGQSLQDLRWPIASN